MAESILAGLGPVGSTQVIDTGANNFVQTRITGQNGRILELIRYDNRNARLGGHCFVGPFTPNAGGCDDPTAFENGAKTLELYMNNPKARSPFQIQCGSGGMQAAFVVIPLFAILGRRARSRRSSPK